MLKALTVGYYLRIAKRVFLDKLKVYITIRHGALAKLIINTNLSAISRSNE